MLIETVAVKGDGMTRRERKTNMKNKTLIEQSEFIKTFLEGHKEEREKREARRREQELSSKKTNISLDVFTAKGGPKPTHRKGGGRSGHSTGAQPEEVASAIRTSRREANEDEGPSLSEKLAVKKTGVRPGPAIHIRRSLRKRKTTIPKKKDKPKKSSDIFDDLLNPPTQPKIVRTPSGSPRTKSPSEYRSDSPKNDPWRKR